MAGQPVSPKPTPLQSVSPPSLAANPGVLKPITTTSPLNRNSPSASAVSSMVDVSGSNSGNSGKSGNNESRTRRRKHAPRHSERLVSLDAFRGFIMLILAAKGFGLLAFSRIDEAAPVWQTHDHALWQRISFHFDHPAWMSSSDYFKVSFWDLIQPSFMFMVGAAMPFSNRRRASNGQGAAGRTMHAIMRSLALILLGVFLSSLGHEHTYWIFPNVLCQIGLGYFFVWMLHHLRVSLQIVALIVILGGYWGWFYMSPPPADYDYAAVNASLKKGEVFEGKYAAWSKNANAAFFFDGWLLPRLRSSKDPEESPASAVISTMNQWRFASVGLQESPSPTGDPDPTGSELPKADPPQPPEAETKAVDIASEPNKPAWYRQWFLSNTEPFQFNRDGYTTLNFIPSIGTTLLGVLCGQLLIKSETSRWMKLALLILTASVCLGLGIAADHTICPIVKRIWTPSWVLFSGGYVIGMLAIFYLLFDIAPLRLLAFPLVVVGMNSILTYMLGQTVSGWMREHVVKVHFSGMIENVFGPKALDPMWYGPITLPTTVIVLFWLFLLWLYRQKIFLRL